MKAKETVKRLAEKNKFFEGIINGCFLLSGIGTSCVCLVFRVIPVKKNKIVFSSWKGKRCGDNPRYISDVLTKRNKGYEIVWLLDKNYDGDVPEGVRRVDNSPLRTLFELCTAKVWVDCSTKELGLLKRKGQLYIQTWHGSYGLKKLYADIPDKLRFIEKTYMQYNSKIMDVMVSNSRQTSEIYHRAMWYSGEMLEYGSPRNDLFFKSVEPIRQKVKDEFGVTGKNIVLYAPTFRNNLTTNQFDLDYERLKMNLEKRFGGEWVVLIRLHPHNSVEADKSIQYNSDIINASKYNDMQELLVASDILITDYSSCMFDFVTTEKVCFLYASDVEEYREERDYYFEIEELPFPLAQNNNQMEQVIVNFNEDVYLRDLRALFKQVGLNETGNASEKVADYIEKWMEEN